MIFTSNSLLGDGLFASPGFIKVMDEGNEANFFHTSASSSSTPASTSAVHKAVDVALFDKSVSVFYLMNTAEDNALVRNQGVNINDNNALAPNNMFTTNTHIHSGEQWTLSWPAMGLGKLGSTLDH